MKSSSSEVRVADFATRELRTGTWTRLGGGQVRGDAVTEDLLSGLVDETRAAARAQGYAVGWAEGRRAAEEQAEAAATAYAAQQRAAEERREAEHRAAVDALQAATEQLTAATAAACARVEEHALEVAVALTEELLGHELRVAEAPGVDAVRRALALMPGEPVVRIRVSPEDGHGPALAELGELAGAATVVLDPALRRGDAVVETDGSVLDARVSGAMERVREVLLP